MASATTKHPARLIEIDLPLRAISRESQREKSIRQGHISTMHVWWARRPLAACRAVIAASLWIDPASPDAPASYCDALREVLIRFARRAIAERPLGELLGDSYARWRLLSEVGDRKPRKDHLDLRAALLDIVAIVASWDAVSNPAIVELIETLTVESHAALTGERTTRPLVVDPFAGGGAMPLEALRLGADAFASDLNPVAVLLNRVVLEYAPACPDSFIDDVRRWGAWIAAESAKRLAKLYPLDADGAKPIAYIWARAVSCEGPACGRIVPLVRSFWLTKRDSGAVGVALDLKSKTGAPGFLVTENPKKGDVASGTVRKGAAVCPWCGHTTPVARIRLQLTKVRGGADTAVMVAVVTETRTGKRRYRSPESTDMKAFEAARRYLAELERTDPDLLPTEALPPKGTLGFRVQNYGMLQFRDLYNARQLTTLATFAALLREVEDKADSEVVSATLSLALGRLQDLNSSLATWADTVVGANRAQNRVSMVWDYVEAAPLAGAGGGWQGQVEWVVRALEHLKGIKRHGTVVQSPAQTHPLPDDSAALLATDPPYYDAFGYADLADLFFVWLKRATRRPSSRFAEIGKDGKTPKHLEIVVNPGAEADGRGAKDHAWFYEQMRLAFAEARRVVAPGGLAVIVFAHKDTKSWEALLAGVIEAGWVVTASWPIATERPTRQRALGSAALASSVHLVCRPREDASGALRDDLVGDWRLVQAELPLRIHAWLPRLASEGIVGADALFACLGPALEVFSRFTRVEKTSGEAVTLREYLEQVWAAVSREAIGMLFAGAETAGLEADARVTAMFLWTVYAPGPGDESTAAAADGTDPEEAADLEGDEIEERASPGAVVLEYDAIRKIAQGLGAHLEDLVQVIDVRGAKAYLVPVSDRAGQLFARARPTTPAKSASKKKQMRLFEGGEEGGEPAHLGELGARRTAATTLDQLHQAMLLFGAGRSDAVKRMLVEDGIGRQKQFWALAQTLSALYPRSSDEKRWVDGVLARKKGLGF